MEYHSDRFEDYSLLLFDAKKLLAIMPANKVDQQIISHQGLSYGGIVTDDSLKNDDIILVLKSFLEFLAIQKLNGILIKLIPSIYQVRSNDELKYLMFFIGAKLVKRELLSVISNDQPLLISNLRKRGLKKARQANLRIIEEAKLDFFWETILTPNLKRRYEKEPVHNLEEIQNLKSKFPENIRQFNVYSDDDIIAGTTVFETKNVAHVQYIAASSKGKDLGALDFLFLELITSTFAEKSYFDFGNSNEKEGMKINKGLLYWKESFGASGVTQDFYQIDVMSYKSLKTIYGD